MTVEFYRWLPEKGYRFLIFRAHTGAEYEVETTWLWTSEPYSDTKYASERKTLALAGGRLPGEGDAKSYIVGSKFVTDSMEGKYNDSPREIRVQTFSGRAVAAGFCEQTDRSQQFRN